MEPNCDGRQDNHQAGQGVKSLPALLGDGNANSTGGRNDLVVASEVMDLAFEVTWISFKICGLLADVARSLAEPPRGDLSARPSQLQQHLAPLREITAAIPESERRIRLLEAKTVSFQPEIFDVFLEDCRSALVTFKEVGGNLAGIIGLDGSTSPAMTVAETLIQVMKQLQTGSEKVSGLPGSGLAVSSQCLAVTALNLQRQAGKLVEKAASHS